MLTLLAENLLEAATVTCSAAALTELARLYNREHAEQYVAGFPQAWTLTDIAPLPLALGGPVLAQIDIDIDRGSAKAVSALGLVHHNLTGVTVTLYGDATFPPTTPRLSFMPTGADVLRTFTEQSFRYWRLRIPAMAAAPAIGELMLGVPRVLRSPVARISNRAIVGNVARGRTPAGYPRGTKRGPAHLRLSYAWNFVDLAADQVALDAAYADCDEGAKALLVQDPFGVVRWMKIQDDELAGDILSGRGNSARLTLEEVPL